MKRRGDSYWKLLKKFGKISIKNLPQTLIIY